MITLNDQPPIEKITAVKTERDGHKWLAPTAIGLGLLFIIGGIAFLNYDHNRPVVQLPNYSPNVVSPNPSLSPTISPATPTPTSVAVVIVTPSPTSPTPTITNATKDGVVAGAATYKSNKKSSLSTTKTTTSSNSSSSSSSQLADYKPNPSQSSESLPAYTPNVELPTYQPQYSSPTPTPSPEVKQTIRVTLAVPGKDYMIDVAPGATVLDVLNAARAKGLTFKTEYFPSYGSEKVTEINGQAENGSHFWLYTVNGKFASKGISLQTVNEFDVIIWSQS